MKVSKITSIALLLALLLSIFDGVATYIEASHEEFEELNWLPRMIQKKSGLDNWLIFHIAYFTLLAIFLAIALWEKLAPLEKLFYWKKIFWPIYFWLAVEIFLLITHLRIFILGGIL